MFRIFYSFDNFREISYEPESTRYIKRQFIQVDRIQKNSIWDLLN